MLQVRTYNKKKNQKKKSEREKLTDERKEINKMNKYFDYKQKIDYLKLKFAQHLFTCTVY
jgi:hypothetical protein